MPRKKRDWYPGATYHVMCRGIRRMAIFREEEDYEMFLLMVKKTMECLPFTLHSYCMMTNHIHLQITTMDSEIWKIMKRLLSSYARNFNNKYGYSGHLFDSRYTSCLIEDAIYFLEVSRYIHLNPVRAGMVREPVTYPYSSYAYYVSGKENPLLDKSRVLGNFRTEQEEKYRMFVECIDGFEIEVEATTIRGQQQMISIIGLGDQAVKEAGERMQAALEFCGYDIPKDKVIISLLAYGIDQCYPVEHKALMCKIENEGLLLSEYPPETVPYRHSFPRRNRIIAGLSDVLYVIDAGKNSGTKTTVEAAERYGKQIVEASFYKDV